MTITKQESDALNIIRWSSTIAIVLCHYLQGYGSAWAWVLNLGVQIFFFLSGFLYGCKKVFSYSKFYLGRFRKVFLPYVTWVVIAFIMLCLFADNSAPPMRNYLFINCLKQCSSARLSQV